ncbi:TRAP transporter substrate-binding protein [Paenibacillus sp. tmac-D7]|uniref:TRAP transporter substrate-binding protein n=1 Tax=Paenibacillus sp. tmac-D7 TaxID=2591462 RepID=UPI00215B6A4C|nr:TRAP transporter substrate-binding protein [Paenibacillus sp. tmac-D7]
MKKTLSVLFIGAWAAVAVGCGQGTGKEVSSSQSSGSSAPVKVMKLATVSPKERSLTQGLYKFGEIVEKESGGSIKVEVYPDGQLGGDIQTFEGMKMGTIHGSTMSTGLIASFAKRFNVFDLPFLFKDEATAYKVLDGPLGKELLNDLPSTGVIGLNYWENGFRHLTNSRREVKSLDDIKGLKIRTLENQLHIDLWKELGATPTPMAFTELFTALEQKVVDGQENPAGNVKVSKFYEVQKYMTLTGHVYNASPFMISKKFWDSLSDKEREIMTKAAEEAKDFQRKANQKEGSNATEYLRQNGMKVTELTAEQKKQFFDKVQPVYKKFAPTIGEDYVNKLYEAVR